MLCHIVTYCHNVSPSHKCRHKAGWRTLQDLWLLQSAVCPAWKWQLSRTPGNNLRIWHSQQKTHFLISFVLTPGRPWPRRKERRGAWRWRGAATRVPWTWQTSPDPPRSLLIHQGLDICLNFEYWWVGDQDVVPGKIFHCNIFAAIVNFTFKLGKYS